MFTITVIIPMYNNEDTIIDALESIKRQSAIKNVIQIIVIDDGSTDSSSNVVNSYADNNDLPIVLVKQKNGGAASARNKGLSMAKGEWIAFLDADDEWRPNRLARQIEVINSNPEIDFLGAGCNDIPLIILGRRITDLYKANIYDITIKYFPCTPSIIMRRKIYDEIGGFNENWRYSEDGEYYTRICMKYNYYYLPESLVDIGHGKRSFGEKGLSGNLKKMYEGNKNIISNLYSDGVISSLYYVFLRFFYYLKYIRRVIITKLGK